MKLFVKYGLFEKSEELEIHWYDDEEFASRAKEIAIVPNLSLYDLLQLRPEEEDKLLTYTDYLEIERSNNLDRVPERYRDKCSTHLCDKMSREYLQGLALDSLLDLMPLLPILCGIKIIEKLKNEDLLRICQAAKLVTTWRAHAMKPRPPIRLTIVDGPINSNVTSSNCHEQQAGVVAVAVERSSSHSTVGELDQSNPEDEEVRRRRQADRGTRYGWQRWASSQFRMPGHFASRITFMSVNRKKSKNCRRRR
ncbi:unnamed protein product, partial [Trichogramma brassicae]